MKNNIFIDKICNMLNLKSITTRSFVYLVDCILLGIVMVKVPGRNAFKLYFTIFSLCKKTLKELFRYTNSIKGDSGRQEYGFLFTRRIVAR